MQGFARSCARVCCTSCGGRGTLFLGKHGLLVPNRLATIEDRCHCNYGQKGFCVEIGFQTEPPRAICEIKATYAFSSLYEKVSRPLGILSWKRIEKGRK